MVRMSVPWIPSTSLTKKRPATIGSWGSSIASRTGSLICSRNMDRPKMTMIHHISTTLQQASRQSKSLLPILIHAHTRPSAISKRHRWNLWGFLPKVNKSKTIRLARRRSSKDWRVQCRWGRRATWVEICTICMGTPIWTCHAYHRQSYRAL